MQLRRLARGGRVGRSGECFDVISPRRLGLPRAGQFGLCAHVDYTQARKIVDRCLFLPVTFRTVILDRMSDVTGILAAIEQDDPHAGE
jgi:hypothetical protein